MSKRNAPPTARAMVIAALSAAITAAETAHRDELATLREFEEEEKKRPKAEEPKRGIFLQRSRLRRIYAGIETLREAEMIVERGTSESSPATVGGLFEMIRAHERIRGFFAPRKGAEEQVAAALEALDAVEASLKTGEV